MKRKCIRAVALIIAISVLFVQVDAVSANAVVNAPCVEQGYPQIQGMGFVAEWVAGLGVSAGRLVAFAFVLTLLGFVVENGISNAWENREEYLSYLTNLKEDFTSWCAESKEWCSIKANDFDMWLDMVAQGTLDKSSDCWQAIKDYCVDLKTRIDNLNKPVTSSEVIKVDGAEEWFLAQTNITHPVSSKTVSSTNYTDAPQIVTANLKNWGREVYYGSNTKLVSFKFADSANILIAINADWSTDGCYPYGGVNGLYNFVTYYSNSNIKGFPAFAGGRLWTMYKSSPIMDDKVLTFQFDCNLPSPYYDDVVIPALCSFASGYLNGYKDWDIEIPKDDGIAEDVAQGLTVAGGTSGVIERDGSLDNLDVVGVSGVKDDVVPIDWDNVSVEDLSNPYPYDDVKTVDLVDGVIVGTDTPIDEVVPPIDGSDTSSDRNNYTLSGLTELFPFCIPFDMVMLFQTLKADAVAPCFNWKFVYYVDGEKKTEDIVLDLSKFNKVAEILRMMELLAFMIALTIKTRDLIRG